MSKISWLSVAAGAAPFVAVIALKLLLDLRLAPLLVKYLYRLPFRNYFREKPVQLGGIWEHLWGPGGSGTYENDIDRHGHCELRQIGSYIYAEFYSQAVLYAFFGQIKHGYVVGDWYDVKDPVGYFGVFQLEIKNSSQLSGLWLGHSKQQRTIRSDSSSWRRVGG